MDNIVKKQLEHYVYFTQTINNLTTFILLNTTNISTMNFLKKTVNDIIKENLYILYLSFVPEIKKLPRYIHAIYKKWYTDNIGESTIENWMLFLSDYSKINEFINNSDMTLLFFKNYKKKLEITGNIEINLNIIDIKLRNVFLMAGYAIILKQINGTGKVFGR
jgi:hypothetical protein